MCMCVTVFMCACTSWVDHNGAASQGLSSPSVFDDAPMHYFLHNAPIMGHCPLAVASELPRGASPGPSPGSSVLQSGNFKNARAVTHSHCCPFISAPPMTVSPCLAGKWDCVGLNVYRAQRPLVKSGRFGPRWLASTEFLQVVSNSIFPEPRQPRLDLQISSFLFAPSCFSVL